jgi:uncharacterized protein (DUF2336 family)
MSTETALISELQEALSHGSGERRLKTLQRITDLFMFGSSHFSPEHVSVFEGVFNHLLADIEMSARAMLASRLATVGNAPPQTMRKLAFDDSIAIAAPVLTQSSALDNATLVENARTKSQDHLLAISRRTSLAETVTDILVERGNRDVALSTARNKGAKFSEAGFVRLVKRSERDDELAQSVGSRAEIPRQHFLKLLNTASKAVRIALEAAHPEHAHEVKHIVSEAAGAIQARAAVASRDYAAARTLIDSLRASGQLHEATVEAFAKTGKFEETAVGLATLCGLPVEIVERAMVRDREDTVLIIAKAAGFSWASAKALLMLRAGKSGLSPQAIQNCSAIFEKLKRETALQVVKFQREKQAEKADV